MRKLILILILLAVAGVIAYAAFRVGPPPAIAIEPAAQVIGRKTPVIVRVSEPTRGLSNVRVVLGKYADPGLPVRNVDLALICDVLHHIKDRDQYLKALAAYLSPSGRIAVIDFVPGKGGHAKDAEQQIGKSQVDTWMAAAGLKPVEDIALFDDKYFVIYGR